MCVSAHITDGDLGGICHRAQICERLHCGGRDALAVALVVLDEIVFKSAKAGC
jgi:hypothetical protein